MPLESILSGGATLWDFLLCALAALGLGLLTALTYTYRNRSTASMASTLVLLPGAVAAVILMVNGNLGVGVAVAGAFSLVRFRSVPGSAREITALFTAMAIGLACGTGYLLAAVALTVLMSLATLALARLSFGENKLDERVLTITVSESVDYEGLFDDVLSQYASAASLVRVRTISMGSLYELTYRVVLRAHAGTRDFLDALRTRNGNLNIKLGRNANNREEL